MPTLNINTDFGENSNLWAPSNIATFLLVMTLKELNERKRDQQVHLFIDNNEVAVIKTNEKIETPISIGSHKMQAKYKGLSTCEYEFEMEDGLSSKRIFCVGNSDFRQKMSIINWLIVIYFFVFLLFILPVFPKMRLAFVTLILALPIIGILAFYFVAIKRKTILDISEVWPEYD